MLQRNWSSVAVVSQSHLLSQSSCAVARTPNPISPPPSVVRVRTLRTSSMRTAPIQAQQPSYTTYATQSTPMNSSRPSGRSSSSSSFAPPHRPAASFAALGLSPTLVNALQTSLSITTPTPIQAHAIPTLMQGCSALLAANTGGGKTLAYLLPIIHQLKRDESLGIRTRLQRPRALIVVPNRELAVQILSVAKSLSLQAKFRSFASTGFIPLHKLSRALQNPIDLLVLTPGRLDFLVKSSRISLTDVRYLVIDEADTIMSEEHGFVEGITKNLLKPLRDAEEKRKREANIGMVATADNNQHAIVDELKQLAASLSEVPSEGATMPDAATATPSPTMPNTPFSTPPSNDSVQFIFCSASIPTVLERAVTAGSSASGTPTPPHSRSSAPTRSGLSYPGLVRLHVPTLHHLAPRLKLNHVLVGNEDKLQLLWKLLQNESNNYKKRLMHGRTRQQNRQELMEECGGDEKLFWERIIRADQGRPMPKTDAEQGEDDGQRRQASDILVQKQLEYDEASQMNDDGVAPKKSKKNKKKTTPVNDATLDAEEEDDEDKLDPDHPSHAQREDGPTPSSHEQSTPRLSLPLPPTLIFCNTVSCCNAVAWFLAEKGINVGHYHGLMPPQFRTLHFRDFLSGETSILVSTDLGSRGLDFGCRTQHVIHFDFPFHVNDFIHRTGRTARNGGQGKSTALVMKKDRVLADAILRLTNRGLSIEQLTADRSRYGMDGLPLSDAVYSAMQKRTADRQQRSSSSTTTSANGTKILSPNRRQARPPSMPIGSQPRRRWMRYMPAGQRNQYKLLYSKTVTMPPIPGSRRSEKKGEQKQQRIYEEAQKRRMERHHQEQSVMSSSAFYESSSPSAPSPSNPTPPNSDSERHHHHHHHHHPARFPSAGPRRTAILRPVGPLTHKQKLGAIFASDNTPAATPTSSKGGRGKKKAAAH